MFTLLFKVLEFSAFNVKELCRRRHTARPRLSRPELAKISLFRLALKFCSGYSTTVTSHYDSFMFAADLDRFGLNTHFTALALELEEICL